MKPMLPTDPAPLSAIEPTEAEIQKMAYHLWVEGGCLEGVELDNWLAAKELLRHRHGHVHGHAVRGTHSTATIRTTAKT
ncbi:MAG: DUF2934 domain-containing protein [Verrucomicrobia bacterium]|nr:DUF2934 domain-containing protein [Verrucomicrobiota bacterium]